MKHCISIFLISFIINISFAQEYKTPSWLQDLPQNESDCIYAIGFSDPRMSDSVLAKNLALNRALSIAAITKQSKISYVSDFYEAKSEEYRWYFTKESFEEYGKIKASAYINDNYEIIKTETNSNGEIILLLKLFPSQDINLEHNYFIDLEYYNQVFELNNTRSLEYFRNIKLNTLWIKNENKDSLKTYYEISNFNDYINIEEIYDTLEIEAPRFHYTYKSSLENNIDFKDFGSYSSLSKGLWQAYLDSYTQSILLITKNYSSKLGSIQDDFKENRNDSGNNDLKTESLARNTFMNTLSFELGGIEIFNNNLYNRLYLENKRIAYKNETFFKDKTSSQKDKNKKECFLKKWFKKGQKIHKTFEYVG